MARSRDYSTESNASRIRDNSIYVGFVKSVTDAQKMGRIAVWIPELGGAPDKEASWVICSYASPFAGATNSAQISGQNTTSAGSQQSYGMWAVPPDINNEVLVCFANGDIGRGFWFACVWQQNMNHMVPGIAGNISNDASATASGVIPPVVEYNKASAVLGNQGAAGPQRPTFTPLANGLAATGLGGDTQRGAGTSSARRESPSKTIGIASPRGATMVIDDNEDDEFIRLRTRSGTQILIQETSGYVYINSQGGNAWVEISDTSIDIYSANSVSIRSQGDFNVRADGNILLDAGTSISLRAGTDITMQAANTIQVGAAKGLNLAVSGGNLAFAASGDLLLKATGNLRSQSGSDTTMLAGGTHQRQASQIKDNGAAPAVPAVTPTGPIGKTVPDVAAGKGTTLNTITSRTPTHEPYAGHPKPGLPPPGVPSTQAQINARPGVGSGPTTAAPTMTKTVMTGEGPKTITVASDGTKCALGVGTKACSTNVYNAIQTASSATNVPFGNMMAMADRESSFAPNAAASTSSASGVFQFTSSTWTQMVTSYGNAHNITYGDINDPTANATMAGIYYNENASTLMKAGVASPTCGQVYMLHMLGPSGGTKFVAAAQSNPDAPLSSVLSPQEIANNSPGWFNSSQTVGEAYSKIDGTMNGLASAYDTQAGLPSPCDRTSATAAVSNTGSTGASATGTTTTGSLQSTGIYTSTA